ncbi:MAG: hypothetical protein NZ873_00660 [Crenarchaeota archaeon]|nr:hypothetical protein [Thermoproteota archaeon]MDW8033680.1 hypothetical protein [Nitrososphaerota archaeon]
MFKRWAKGEYEIELTLRIQEVGDRHPFKAVEWGNELIKLGDFLKEAREVSPSNPKKITFESKGVRMNLRIIGIEILRQGDKSIDLRLIAEKE